MNIYLVTNDKWGYDEYNGFVINAITANNAIKIAQEKGGSYLFDDPLVKLIGKSCENEEGVILGSYNAG